MPPLYESKRAQKLHRRRLHRRAIRSHTEKCMGRGPSIDDFVVLKKIERDIMYLSVMEALFIREIKPNLNTRDEFRGRELRIKI